MYICLIGRSQGWSIIPPKYLCGFNKKEKKHHLHKLQNNLENPQPKKLDPVAFSGCEIKKNIWSSKVHFKKCTMHNNANNSSVSIFVLFALLNIIIA